MPKYNRQLVIAFLTGGGDELIVTNSKMISDKQRAQALESEVVLVHQGSALAVDNEGAGFDSDDIEVVAKAINGQLNVKQAITADSRIYLNGHGDWQGQKIGCWGPRTVARMLKHVGMPSVKNLNVIACDLARDADTANTARIAHSASSFASNLHRTLKETEGVAVTLHARPYRTGVVSEEIAADNPEQWGRKLTADDQDMNKGEVHRRPSSKYKFSWQNDTQVREVVQYSEEGLFRLDD
jgi:hypothetical protein